MGKRDGIAKKPGRWGVWTFLLVGTAIFLVMLVLWLPFTIGSGGLIATSTPRPTPTPARVSPETESHPPAYYLQKGTEYAESGELSEAEESLLEAVRLAPDMFEARMNLGYVYYRQERYEEAVEEYRVAAELAPDRADVRHNLGSALLRLSVENPESKEALVEQAIIELEWAIELAPDMAAPYFSLGVAYKSIGEDEKAVQAFYDFQERDTGEDPRASADARRYLQELGTPEQ